jgi:hypothetical protein
LERGKLVNVAVMWKMPPEWGEGHFSGKKGGNCKWRVGLKLEKKKGHPSRRTLNKQSLQKQIADSRRQVSCRIR